MKVGDLVLYEPKVSFKRGFRSIYSAKIDEIDDTDTGVFRLAVLTVFSEYHYHPDHPERGAYLPAPTRDCAALEELSPFPPDSPMLRDIAIGRRTKT